MAVNLEKLTVKLPAPPDIPPADRLQLLSPMESRYFTDSKEFYPFLSEFGLMRARTMVEVEYLKALSEEGLIPALNRDESDFLDGLVINFTPEDASRIDEIDGQIHHDILATVSVMKEKMVGTPYERLTELIHLCPTSEDIDNIAKRVMFNIARDRILHPAQKKLVDTILTQAEKSSNAVMLGETHGQPAGVTTYGKEMLIFGIRLKDQLQKAREIKLKGKFNGLIGTYSGFQAAFRDKVSLETWVEFTKKFVGSFGLDPILTTTQGNPNDDLVEFLQSIQLFNEISHSLAQDVWSYIDQGELVQNARGAGSSTSAAKVNPWRGEHSETMFELANGQIDVYVRNLPETRRQRDLSDKTMMRFIGESLAICTNGWRYLGQQIGSTAPNREKMMEMILQDYSWLSEAVQLVLRESGVQGGYELIKQKMQGRTFSREQFAELIDRTIVECFSVPLREDGLHLNEAELSEEQLATITKLQSLSPQQFIDDALKLTQILLKEEGLEE